MNITQIRYFITVAQMQNMSKAAELLHLSQPSLSKSIAKLEEELSVPLFTRTGRKITLNEAGKRFLTAAMTMLQELYDAEEEMQELAGGTGNRLAIGLYGAHPAILSYLALFARQYPEVEYNLTCNIESIEHLDIADFDMLVYPDTPKYEKFVGTKLCDERYLLALPVRHLLAGRAAVVPRDFLEEPMVFLQGGAGYKELCHTLCAAMNPGLKVRGFVTAPEIHRKMIAEGMALGFVPEGCAESYRRDPKIRLRPITDDKFSRSLLLCFKREKHASPLARIFQRFMTDHVGGEEQSSAGKDVLPSQAAEGEAPPAPASADSR